MMYLRWVAKSVCSYALLVLGVVFLVLECVVWGAISVVLFQILPASVGRRIGRLAAMHFFRLFLATLEMAGAWRLDLSALDRLVHDGALIIAPNHPGLLDAVLVVSRLPNAVCVMKAGLLNNFLLGPAGRLARYVRNDTLLRLVSTAGNELRLGGQLLLFPEGTRTVGGAVGPFTEAVGALSRRSGVPVQTVIIETDSQFLGKGWRNLTRPEFPLHFRMHLGRRFDPPNDVHAFTQELERYFHRELSGRATAVALSGPVSTQPVENAPHLRG